MPQMIREVATAVGLIPAEAVVDLADALGEAQMDGTFGIHPNCDGCVECFRILS